ncbi:MAG: hypothetical protein ACRDF4_07630, partial [Rhabdochlamydiaceae bacterium]
MTYKIGVTSRIWSVNANIKLKTAPSQTEYHVYKSSFKKQDIVEIDLLRALSDESAFYFYKALD